MHDIKNEELINSLNLPALDYVECLYLFYRVVLCHDWLRTHGPVVDADVVDQAGPEGPELPTVRKD